MDLDYNTRDFKKLVRDLEPKDTFVTEKSFIQNGRFWVVKNDTQLGKITVETEDQGSEFELSYRDNSNLLWLICRLEEKGF